MDSTEQPQPDLAQVLNTRICDLGLTIENSAVEKFSQQLHRELERKKVFKFRPACYLTDEWGCPSGEPIIGVPFYLARPDLGQIESENNDLENDREIMMYLRHEAGHAFNYAYKLHRTPEWKQLFGPYRRPYRENYRPVLFSKDYVRYLPGWYAQKHPDEDFAETFAVWLTPRSAWRRQYKGWPAMGKLRYIERVSRAVADVEPIVNTGEVDITPDDMKVTVEQFYQQAAKERQARIDIALDAHLGQIFLARRRKESRPAADIIGRYQTELVDKIAYWTGVRRPIVRGLIESI